MILFLVMEELYLIRHGEAEHQVGELTAGWTDTNLTRFGQKQAILTGHKLEGILKFKDFQLYSSDLSRASETTEIIADILDTSVNLNPNLREMNNGSAINKTKEEASLLQLPETEPILDWIPYPGGESWRLMKNRIYSFMNEINDKENNTKVIVSHGNPLIVIVFWWLQLPKDAKISFVFDNCSITELNINEWNERTITRLNDTTHLAEKE